MPRIETFMEVQSPVNRVYDQWRRFENAACVSEDGLREVPCDGDPPDTESNDPIVQYDPPRPAIGATTRRTVAFRPKGGDTTRVTLTVDYEAQANIEDLGRCMAATAREIRADLRRFREFLRNGSLTAGPVRSAAPRS